MDSQIKMACDGFSLIYENFEFEEAQTYKIVKGFIVQNQQTQDKKIIPASVKIFKKNQYINQRINVQIEIEKNISHPSIIKFLKFHSDEKFLYYITQPCQAEESLRHKLDHNHLENTEDEWINIYQSILSALRYLHFQPRDNTNENIKPKIFHQKVQPENIFFGPHKVVKLIDHSWIRLMSELNEKTIYSFKYRSPQLYYSSEYDDKCDVWSLGAIMYEIIKKEPLIYENQRGKKLVNEYTLSQNKILNIKFQNFKHGKFFKKMLSNILVFEPSKRWSSDAAWKDYKEYFKDSKIVLAQQQRSPIKKVNMIVKGIKIIRRQVAQQGQWLINNPQYYIKSEDLVLKTGLRFNIYRGIIANKINKSQFDVAVKVLRDKVKKQISRYIQDWGIYFQKAVEFIQIMNNNKVSGIPKLYTYGIDSQKVYFVLELFQKGSVNHNLKLFEDNQLLVIRLYQTILDTLDFIFNTFKKSFKNHDKILFGITTICPSNILQTIDSKFKLNIDFGIARYQQIIYASPQPLDIQEQVKYMSPQSLQKDINPSFLSQKSFLWSLGVVVYQLLFQRHLFASNEKHQLKDQILTILSDTSIIQQRKNYNKFQYADFWHNILTKSIRQDPNQRWSIKEALKYLQSYMKEKSIRSCLPDQSLQILVKGISIEKEQIEQQQVQIIEIKQPKLSDKKPQVPDKQRFDVQGEQLAIIQIKQQPQSIKKQVKQKKKKIIVMPPPKKVKAKNSQNQSKEKIQQIKQQEGKIEQIKIQEKKIEQQVLVQVIKENPSLLTDYQTQQQKRRAKYQHFKQKFKQDKVSIDYRELLAMHILILLQQISQQSISMHHCILNIYLSSFLSMKHVQYQNILQSYQQYFQTLKVSPKIKNTFIDLNNLKKQTKQQFQQCFCNYLDLSFLEIKTSAKYNHLIPYLWGLTVAESLQQKTKQLLIYQKFKSEMQQNEQLGQYAQQFEIISNQILQKARQKFGIKQQ